MATARASDSRPGRRFQVRWVRWAFFAALAVAAVYYGVLPMLVSVREDIDLVASASVWLIVAALLLEVVSVLFYTGLTQAVLPHDVHLSWFTQGRIDVTGLGVSHVLPGGGATAAGLRYRLMTDAGVPIAEARSLAAVQTVLSDVGLAAVYAVGAVAAYSAVVQRPLLGAVGLVAVVLVTATVVGIRWLALRPPTVREIVSSRPRLIEWFQTLFGEIADLSHRLARDSDRTGAAAGFALANWLLDAAALWACLLAYGYVASAGPLLTAYGFAMLLSLLPFTPGGLGVVESTLTPLLIAFGAPSGVAVMGVVTWRLLQYFLPVPVGLLCWGSLRWGPARADRGRGRRRRGPARPPRA
jgi:uncharacterized protein (TIRG00374 family)